MLFPLPPASMTRVGVPDLRGAWADLLERRTAFATSLVLYGDIVELWAAHEPAIAPLAWSAARARAVWERGLPLAAVAPPPLAADAVEPLLGPAMELLVAVRPARGDAVQRFAEAWDRGDVTTAALLPAPGGVGTVDAALGLDADGVAFLAGVALRPALETYFAPCRGHLDGAEWDRGTCPFCGAPPGFGDLVEDGRRRLACHLCGGGWTFPRLRCALCGLADSKRLTRLEPSEKDEGYFVSACDACRGYVKEIDRRVRWNGGPALVEDWGSPHLDLIARRAGYRRPLPSLVELAG
ncbi:MAG: formate dehydrogenase accessory protein FdhE [Candidatus Rokubacteria bacterium]|nr:formate dehydrogenase accessory protein FdhE [Candidatus Rokubacteria bacterium]